MCCNFSDDVMLPMKRRGLSESSSSSSEDSSKSDSPDEQYVSCAAHCNLLIEIFNFSSLSTSVQLLCNCQMIFSDRNSVYNLSGADFDVFAL